MTALITGASSGIGLELARIFAEHGHDVVLVARSEGKLQSLATELQSRGGRAQVIAADLAAPGGPRAVADRVAERGLTVDILVNNAGYGLFGPFLETSLETELSMIQLNIEATLRIRPLLRATMPGSRRKSGRILNVASTAAFLPGP